MTTAMKYKVTLCRELYTRRQWGRVARFVEKLSLAYKWDLYGEECEVDICPDWVKEIAQTVDPERREEYYTAATKHIKEGLFSALIGDDSYK